MLPEGAARRPPRAQAAARAIETRPLDSFLQRTVPRRYSAFYSQLVALLKLVLPSVAVALVALILLWPQFNPIDQRFRLKPVNVGIEDLENLRMANPRYVGSDSQNQPYTLTADQALQHSGDSNVTDLVKPKGDITLESGTWLSLSADTGTYRKNDQLLDLEGNVNLFHDGGYELSSARAHINLAKNTAEGNDPVTGQGPDTELSGEGFRVYNRGERVIVTGQSRLLIRPGTSGLTSKSGP
ncbi:MAG TPA: LPS export ABC transporter periplasmic protein LptC [Alphaproteobacteria bacterium]|nr:LPS export ABC transporter periplasmic protein LptC [Alphaproteobacteria bacterium]